MNNKTMKIVGWVLSSMVAFIFIGSGAFKLSGGNQEMIIGLGGTQNVLALGVLEVVIAVVFLYPRTGIVGVLLMIAYMGGAMAVHFVSGKSVLPLMVIQALIWVTGAVRFPELIGRLFGKMNE